MFSHLYSAGKYECANKGDKARILSWLRSPKRGPWFCVIADSGKKHLLPWAVINMHDGLGGTVLFETDTVTIPSSDSGWSIVDDCVALLGAGGTKAGILSGDYTVASWKRCASEILEFERRHSYSRGSAWFSMCVWLAQKE